MFSIYICDDNDIQLSEIKRVIANEILIQELNMQIAIATTSPLELINRIKKSAYPSLYFLDMNLDNDYSGITLASKIREIDPFGFIVFITSHDSYMHMTFQHQLGAIDYILKSESDKNSRIIKCLHTALERYSKTTPNQTPSLTLSVGKSIVVVPFSEISHITTSDFPHKIVLYTLNGFHEASGTLKEFENLLDKTFLRCHKNCIINLKQINNIDTSKRMITMQNFLSCDYSIRCKSILLDTLNLKKDGYL